MDCFLAGIFPEGGSELRGTIGKRFVPQTVDNIARELDNITVVRL